MVIFKPGIAHGLAVLFVAAVALPSASQAELLYNAASRVQDMAGRIQAGRAELANRQAGVLRNRAAELRGSGNVARAEWFDKLAGNLERKRDLQLGQAISNLSAGEANRALANSFGSTSTDAPMAISGVAAVAASAAATAPQGTTSPLAASAAAQGQLVTPQMLEAAR